MKPIEDFNYYEILEVSYGASSFEIRQAYKEALSVYNEDSLVTYSFFTDEQREKVLKQIEEAFLTLIDEDKRAEYDEMLVDAGKIDASKLKRKKTKKPIPLFQTNKKSLGEKTLFKRVQEKIEQEDVRKRLDSILAKETISGADLKKLRESLDVALEEIFEIARVRVSILKSIEGDEVEDLPSAIYLKNFLKSYAKILQLDPNKIVEGYINNIRHIQENPV